VPETRLDQHRIQRDLRLIDSAMERVEKPHQPLRHVHRALLRAFEDLVIRLALALDLRRETIEALRAAIGAREQQIADRPRDAAVTVVERMQGDEPQMA
jgi:hypothetical protein